MDEAAFEELVRREDPPMIIVTAATDSERAGCLVGFHSQCSIDPPRYAVWLSKANHTCRVALQTTHLGIHFLSDGHGSLAHLFGERTGDETDKFEQCDHVAGPHGVPLLTGCQNRLVCRRTAMLEEGSDHICFVAEPVDATVTEFEPLRFSAVAGLKAAHTSAERPTPADSRADDRP